MVSAIGRSEVLHRMLPVQKLEVPTGPARGLPVQGNFNINFKFNMGCSCHWQWQGNSSVAVTGPAGPASQGQSRAPDPRFLKSSVQATARGEPLPSVTASRVEGATYSAIGTPEEAAASATGSGAPQGASACGIPTSTATASGSGATSAGPPLLGAHATSYLASSAARRRWAACTVVSTPSLGPGSRCLVRSRIAGGLLGGVVILRSLVLG
jgi:hypothetical protein